MREEDIVARDPAAEDAPVLWPDRWLAMGMRDRLLARSAACDEDYVDAQSFLTRSVARLGGALERLADAIAAHVLATYAPHYSVAMYFSAVAVLRPERF